ncbi:MAG: hypothetical protein DIU72_002545 [Pseudomonadota bacterium]
MHAFVYRLVERLTQEGPPFSRNRHFHTFESPEGKLALRIARRLRSVARDIARASEPPRFQREAERIRLVIPLPDGARTTWLSLWEWQLLSRIAPLPLGRDVGQPAQQRAQAGGGIDEVELDRGRGRG